MDIGHDQRRACCRALFAQRHLDRQRNANGAMNDGGRSSPAANGWKAPTATVAPAPRNSHTAVWTGTEMIIWGGGNGGFPSDGGRYSPVTDIWTALSTASAPAPRAFHT